MNALPLILFFLAVTAITYRYYSAFLAAKVMALDDSRVTSAHRFNDGQNYVPTNKWVMVCVVVTLTASERAWMRAIRGENVTFIAATAGPAHLHIPGSGCC